jgi:hypothetical protein
MLEKLIDETCDKVRTWEDLKKANIAKEANTAL